MQNQSNHPIQTKVLQPLEQDTNNLINKTMKEMMPLFFLHLMNNDTTSILNNSTNPLINYMKNKLLPQAPAPTQTAQGATNRVANQQGQGANDQGQFKIYVTETDIRAATNRVNEINRKVTIK